MESSHLVEVVPYDPGWPARFLALGRALRAGLGARALRIDHIGSTAVPNLAGKPIIDIQISVAQLEPVSAYRAAIEALGLEFRPWNPDRRKRYFRDPGLPRRTHVHVRKAGSLSEQLALLVRDYLRVNDADATAYAALKRRLAREHPEDRHSYTDGKGPFIWELIRRADDWSQSFGWEPGPPDA